MTINQILYFVTVGKFNNITKAAEQLHISQPAITKAIQQLESELGVVLLKHSKNNISLTYEGELFLIKSQEVLTNFQELEDEIRDYGKFKRNRIKVGVPAAIGTLLLPNLNLFIKKNLGIDLEIFEDSSPSTIKKIKNGDLDIAFVLLEEKPYPNLDKKIILKTSLQFCTNCHSKYCDSGRIHREILKQIFERENIILFFPGNLIKRLEDSFDIKPKYLFHSNQVLTIQKYLHYGIASTFQFPQVFKDDKLITSIPLEPEISQYLAMIKRAGGNSCEAVRKVYKYIERNTDKCFDLFTRINE